VSDVSLASKGREGRRGEIVSLEQNANSSPLISRDASFIDLEHALGIERVEGPE
jgi:hypothetical protein